jgi:hypothetical protein
VHKILSIKFSFQLLIRIGSYIPERLVNHLLDRAYNPRELLSLSKEKSA